MTHIRQREPQKPNAQPPKVESVQRAAISPHPTRSPAWTHALSSQPVLSLQPKLTINQPGDEYEQEADHVAAQVMRMPSPAVTGVQRCACGGMAGPDGECEACKAKRLGLQRKGDGIGGSDAPPSVHQTLNHSGEPLDAGTRDFMESRFGQDFSRVRVHADGQAAQSAQDVNARAYTVGQNMVFGAGQYAPKAIEGQKLLAHELVHIVQQGRSIPRRLARQSQKTGSNSSSASSTQQSISRPPGIPLESNVVLYPITLPQKIADAIPDGKVTRVIIPAPPILMGNYGNHEDGSAAAPVTAASTAAIENASSTLTTFGFMSAPGGNAIGLIGFPGKGLGWGHTAIYIRINGKIIVTRGFMPKNRLIAWLKRESVLSGEGSVDARISNDSGAFLRDSAQIVEYPVSEQMALEAAAELPKPGLPPEGFATKYTARPGVKGIPGETNCVGFACEVVESRLGGKVGTDKIGSVTEPANPAEGLQGRFMKTSSGKPEFGELNPMPEALGPGVRGGMPLKFTVLKWGGRFFLVVGGVLAIAAVVRAPEEEKAHVAAVEGGGFLAGFALGAAAGLLCGPGAPACSIVLGLVFGVAGSLAGREAANVAYEEAVGDANKVLEWIKTHTQDGLSQQPTGVKIQMIRALMTGWIGNDDIHAIDQICQSVKTSSEADAIRNAITPQIVPNMTSVGQRTQVRVSLAMMPK